MGSRYESSPAVMIGEWTPASGDAIINLGDNAGVNKFYVRDSDGVDVATIDSDGTSTIILDDIVEGSVIIENVSPLLRLTNTTNGTFTAGDVLNTVEFYSNDASGTYPGILGYIAGIQSSSENFPSMNMYFGMGAGDTPTTIGANPTMVLTASRNVGIGTATPLSAFHVSNSAPYLTLSTTDTSIIADQVLGVLNFYSPDISATSSGGVGGIRMYATTDYNTSKTPSYMSFYTHPDAVNDASVLGNATLSAKIHSDAMLDLYGGTISILAGADNNAKTRTDNTDKLMRFAMPHWDNDDPLPVAVIYGYAGTGDTRINIGGGTGDMNASMTTRIFSADDDSTPTGTEVARFEGGASKALMMGLGNSSLSSWWSNNALTVFQYGVTGAITSNSSDNSTIWSENTYYNGSNNKAITNAVASRLVQVAGGFNFQVAPIVAIDANQTFANAFQIGADASSTFGGDVTVGNSLNIGNGANADLSLLFDAVGTNAELRFREDEDILQFQHAGSYRFLPAITEGFLVERSTNADMAMSIVAGGDIRNSVLYFADQSANAGSIDYDHNTDDMTISALGGVRLDNTVGIGVAPNASWSIYSDRTFTAGGGATGRSLLLSDQLTASASQSIEVIRTASGITANSGTHPLVTSFHSSSVGVGGSATITKLANIYVGGPHTYSGGTVTEGPYSIFVDAGDVRFDGAIIGGSTLAFDGTLVQGAPVTETLDGSGRMDYVHSNIIVVANTGSADDLEIITTAPDGALLIIRPDTGDTITVVNTGNFKLDGGADFVMSSVNDRMYLQGDGTNWIEISRSGNS
jgi:hypothetical protein